MLKLSGIRALLVDQRGICLYDPVRDEVVQLRMVSTWSLSHNPESRPTPSRYFSCPRRSR